jgi:hypothetical protein
MKSIRLTVFWLALASVLALALVGQLATSAVAAIPKIAWIALYDGPAKLEDEPRCLKVDSQGNAYVTGVSYTGSSPVWETATVKYSPGGGQLWAQRYHEGTKAAVVFDLGLDAAANVYIAGYIGSAITGREYLTVKFDTASNRQWSGVYTPPEPDLAWYRGLAVDPAGNAYVTGVYNEMAAEAAYFCTIKYNAAGAQQWLALFPGLAPDTSNEPRAIAVDGEGNVIVTGPSGTGPPNPGSVYATVKYDSAGNQLWASSYQSGLGFDISRAVVADSEGNVIVTGSCGPNMNATEYVTGKYSPGGTELWAKPYDGPGPGNDDPCALAVDGRGNVYVTGESRGAAGNPEYATVKYDGDGNQLWAARYAGPARFWDYPTSLAVDQQGNVNVTGVSYNADYSKDYATLKYSPEGELLWEARYPTGYDALHDVPWRDIIPYHLLALDPWGNILVSGPYRHPDGNVDYLTIKYRQATLMGGVFLNLLLGD